MNPKDNKQSLDMRSPYIKSSVYGIDNMRSNTLSIKEQREASDTLLRQKINNISKKVVGEEIKKFAEVASREISQEFENLEKRLEKNVAVNLNRRIDFVEQNMYEYTSLQNENLSSLGKELSKLVDSKLTNLNEKLNDIENKLKDLESFSEYIASRSEVEEEKVNNNEQDYSLNLSNINKDVLEKEEKVNEYENNVEEVIEENISIAEPEIVLKVSGVAGEVKEEKAQAVREDYSNYTSDTDYANKKVKNIAGLFEKHGALFKKNTFISKLKDIDVEKFLNNKDEYADISESDREKIYDILLDLMDKLSIDPKDDETIEDFLKRLYKEEYRVNN